MASDPSVIEKLSKDINAGKIDRAYFFYGPEVYIRDRAIDRIRRKLLPAGLESLNQSVMEGDVSLGELREAAQILPMMGDRRLIILKDWLPFMDKRVSLEQADVAAMLNSIPDTCCLIVIGPENTDERRKHVQALLKYARAVKFEYLEGDNLKKYVLDHIKPKTIEPAAMGQLVYLTGKSLMALMSEADKLASYIGDRDVITLQDVDAMVTPTAEIYVFGLIDNLMAGRLGQAHEVKQRMLESGQKPVGIIALLTMQMRRLTHIRLMRDKGVSLDEIRQKLDLTGKAASASASQAARFSAEVLEEGYRACVEADYAFKSGRARDDAALDDLMLRLGMMGKRK